MGHAARRFVRAIAFALLRIGRASERLLGEVAVATFTSAELDALSVSEWEAFADQGPIVGDGPISWETAFFSAHIRPADSILVVGAGTGRDVLPFLDAGHDVTALDITPRALETLRAKATAHGRTVRTLLSSITSADLPREAFDVVLFSWFSFAYLRGSSERHEALSRSRASLRTGGRILLSYISRPGAGPGSPSFSAGVVARLLGGTKIEAGDQFNVSGTSSRPGVFFSHSFAPTDIEREVGRLGFVIEAHEQPTNAVGLLALTLAPDVAR